MAKRVNILIMGILKISIFLFMIIGFAWSLTESDIKELNNRFKK
jgi:hypothetical protein